MAIGDHAAKEVDMSSETDVRLTPSQRLGRGLKYSAVGPVDVTRGTVGLTLQGAHSTADSIRRRLDKSRLAKEFGDAQGTIAQELAAAQEVLANLPGSSPTRVSPSAGVGPWCCSPWVPWCWPGERWRSRSCAGRCSPSRRRFRRASMWPPNPNLL